MVANNDQKPLRRGSGAEINRPIRLAGSVLDHRAHVCAFFGSADEQFRVLLPFVKEGLELGEKSVHTVDPHSRHEYCQRLALGGINVDERLQNGQFELRDWSNTYFSEDRFDQTQTLAIFRQVMTEARNSGFPLTRFVTDMGWALKADLDANALLEYEATANYDWMQQDGPVNPVICTYDLNRFTADVVVDVMRTHPMVIIGGVLRQNPFFVPPEEFLEELRGKKSNRLKRVG